MMDGDLGNVLLVHNAYQQRGGEDAVFAHEAALLRDAGLNVQVEAFANDSIHTITRKMRVAINANGDRQMAQRIVQRATDFGADLVHIHNFWPLVTPAAHIALASAGIPVVQTLHNYRLLCANGMLMRDGRVCEDCLSDSRVSALRHRCYRRSIAGTGAVLAMQNASIRNPQWVDSVARFVVLTEFARDKFAAAGIPPERMIVKGNSIVDPLPGDPPKVARKGVLFVGRIAPGKGVALLTKAAELAPDVPVTIIGDGPLRGLLEASAPANVEFLGQLTRDRVFEAMATARWLVLPSTWYEGFPVAVVEALAHGLPVIVPRIGGLPDLIARGEAGLVIEPQNVDALAQALAIANSDDLMAEEKQRAARALYEREYEEAKDRDNLIAIYRQAIAHADESGPL